MEDWCTVPAKEAGSCKIYHPDDHDVSRATRVKCGYDEARRGCVAVALIAAAPSCAAARKHDADS